MEQKILEIGILPNGLAKRFLNCVLAVVRNWVFNYTKLSLKKEAVFYF